MGARSRNHCSRGKALSVTYTECVFVGLVIKHAMFVRHNDICGLSGCKIIFPYYLVNGTICEKKVINHEMCKLQVHVTVHH